MFSPTTSVLKVPSARLSGQRQAQSPSPFLKWAGGKSRLLPSFRKYFPKSYRRYFEPFIGGGAVFFHLLPPQAVLSDLNPELINCYEIVRDQVEELIELLKRQRNEKHYFYATRKKDTGKLSALQRAARFIYLNKTCFNGLYRENRSGQFNVPFGKYKNPRICDAENLRAVSLVLQDISLKCGPFDSVLKQARKGDFVYLDPPYHPLNKTSNFTNYTKHSFRHEDQARLAEVVRTLSKRGCLVMLSNSDNELIRDLYDGFRIETVYAPRAINCKADRRGPISELLILNY